MMLSKNNSHLTNGRLAETIALKHLKSNGLKAIEKNYNCRHGEIDLIMQHSNTVVFVEVRYRKNLNYGGAMESITFSKQKKLHKTALHYMQKQGQEINSRFDVIAIHGDLNSAPSIEWIQNAF